MKLNVYVYAALVLALFFGAIGGAKAAGLWSVSGKVTAAGEKVLPAGTNVDEIKGWMTLGDVSKAYGVPVEEMLAAFDLPAGHARHDTDQGSRKRDLLNHQPAHLAGGAPGPGRSRRLRGRWPAGTSCDTTACVACDARRHLFHPSG